MNSDINFFDVFQLHLKTKEGADGQTWISVTAEGADGKRTEVTFWAIKGEAMPLVIGGD